MRSIVLHIAKDRCLDARTNVALDLARTFDGHVTFGQTLPAVSFATGDMVGDLALNLMPVLLEQAAELRQQLEPGMRSAGITWDWRTLPGPARFALPPLTDLADVIVLGACDEYGGAEAYSALAADLVIHSRTPVLLVPEQADHFDLMAPIAVAWNGSPEACRAIRSALPMLAMADEVHLLTVTEEPTSATKLLPPTSGAEYLSRHGIASRITELRANESGVADTLARAALARGANCLVTGAYGRTRLRETLLGGVSRSLMSDALLPLFMVH